MGSGGLNDLIHVLVGYDSLFCRRTVPILTDFFYFLVGVVHILCNAFLDDYFVLSTTLQRYRLSVTTEGLKIFKFS